MENNVKDCSVAINYTIRGALENDSFVPLLYQWEDQSKSVEQCLIEDDDLWNWIRNKGGMNDLYSYIEGRLSWYVYEKDESGEPIYKSYSKTLDELRPIETYDIQEKMLSHFLYLEIDNLYRKCFNISIDCNEYILPYEDFREYDWIAIVQRMYSDMKEKYKDKLTVTTIKEGIRSNLQLKNVFSNTIIDSLVNILNKILETK